MTFTFISYLGCIAHKDTLDTRLLENAIVFLDLVNHRRDPPNRWTRLTFSWRWCIPIFQTQNKSNSPVPSSYSSHSAIEISVLCCMKHNIISLLSLKPIRYLPASVGGVNAEPLCYIVGALRPVDAASRLLVCGC